MKIKVEPCAPYHGEVVHRDRITMADGVSVFKTYYVNITGRSRPERYVWDAGPLTFEDVAGTIRDRGFAGVGFITAFPHITKIFRFAPAVETVLHVRAFYTPGLQPMALEREDSFSEFACLGEALIAADEYRFWGQSVDVGVYLKQWSEWECGGIQNPAKLGVYVAEHTP